MASYITPFFLSTIFLILAFIHFNWVLGGSWGFAASLPTKESGERVLNPKRLDSAVVGCGLLAFGLFYFFRSGVLSFELPALLVTYAGWIIPAIFLLRAVGDFRYIGFFKKVKNTPFERLDTRFFSPLCLFVAVAGVLIQLQVF